MDDNDHEKAIPRQNDPGRCSTRCCTCPAFVGGKQRRLLKWVLVSAISIVLVATITAVVATLPQKSTKQQSPLGPTMCSACPSGTDMTLPDSVFSSRQVPLIETKDLDTSNVTDSFGNVTSSSNATFAALSWLQGLLPNDAEASEEEEEEADVDNSQYPPLISDLSCAEVEILASNYTSEDPECETIQQHVSDLCQCRVPTSAPTMAPSSSVSPTTVPTSQPSMMPVPTNPPTQHPVGPPVRNFDRFTYGETIESDEQTDYGPEEWNRLQCPDKLSCEGWPDTFDYARGWEITRRNHCRHCPADSNETDCGKHHQSPIDLRRSLAINTTDHYNECLDVHLMEYVDGTCTFERLRSTESFVVDRHALRIIQPVAWADRRGEYVLNCRNDTTSRFPRIDFPHGFSNWWFLSHTDFHMPSEHTQDGKRYDAEIQMYHFYSQPGEVVGVDNEMGTVAVFVSAYDDVDDWDVLNEIICAWREDEHRTRQECGLDPIETNYTGCPIYHDPANRALLQSRDEERLSANEILIRNRMLLNMDPNAEMKNVRVDDGIVEDVVDSSPTAPEQRNLLYDFEDASATAWNNYFGLENVKTEYYYRYSGTQTIPPCYGTFYEGDNRKQTNHWRVMKDPVVISTRQLDEMHRLMRDRIAPAGDPVAACLADTAAKVDENGRVNTARPLQKSHTAHFAVFCECNDWESAIPEDQEWCQQPREERFYENPYNVPSDGK